MRERDELAGGHEHGFVPLERLDPREITSFSGLVGQMGKTSLAARELGRAADILCEMFSDPDCLVVMTLSGPMSIAKQDLVIAELTARKWIDVLVSTGAIIVHSLVQEIGKVHFRHDPGWDDTRLYESGYNRVYDTVELEKSLDEVEHMVVRVLKKRDSTRPLSSAELCTLLGEELVGRGADRGILQEAYRQAVPLFIPAFTDSELGLDVAMYNNRSDREGAVDFDPLVDLQHYTGIVSRAKHLGIFTIGGGVPRNWAQQVGPYVDAMQRRGVVDRDQPVKFHYGVRICPEPVHWGGLSGCTYSEGVSWGKFVSPKEGGRFAEVLCDATVVLPLLLLAVSERLGGSRLP
jgi:deoxyhypusine synthase